jgi:hypothetical protein
MPAVPSSAGRSLSFIALAARVRAPASLAHACCTARSAVQGNAREAIERVRSLVAAAESAGGDGASMPSRLSDSGTPEIARPTAARLLYSQRDFVALNTALDSLLLVIPSVDQ